MKNRIILMIIVAMLFSTTSCDDFLDITPEGQVSRDELLSSPEGIEDALYGVYSQLRSTTLYGQELSFSSLEIMAQTMWCYGNNAITALGKYDYKYSTVENTFESIWTKMYNNISNVNSVLNSSLINEEAYPYTIYKGEALGMRAFMHFDLMRIFCEQITQNDSASGIPYATEFSLNTPDFEKLAANYEHVIADLLEAERLLADEDDYAGNGDAFMNDRQTHFNLYAVQATLARVYLTMGKKDKAYEYAKKVIDNSGRTLTTKTQVLGDLAGVLSRTETLFGVYYSNFYSVVSAKLQKMTSYYSLDPRNDILEKYEEDVVGLDYRSNAYFTTVDNGGTETVRLSKLTDVYELQGITSSRPSDLILGVNLIRLPEMYYICAETLLDTDCDSARWYFDEVLEHRGLTRLSDLNESLTQERINLERYKELIGEGQTFFNMKRQHLSIESADGNTTYQPSKEIYVVPIPDIEYENRY